MLALPRQQCRPLLAQAPGACRHRCDLLRGCRRAGAGGAEVSACHWVWCMAALHARTDCAGPRALWRRQVDAHGAVLAVQKHCVGFGSQGWCCRDGAVGGLRGRESMMHQGLQPRWPPGHKATTLNSRVLRGGLCLRRLRMLLRGTALWAAGQDRRGSGAHVRRGWRRVGSPMSRTCHANSAILWAAQGPSAANSLGMSCGPVETGSVCVSACVTLTSVTARCASPVRRCAR